MEICREMNQQIMKIQAINLSQFRFYERFLKANQIAVCPFFLTFRCLKPCLITIILAPKLQIKQIIEIPQKLFISISINKDNNLSCYVSN